MNKKQYHHVWQALEDDPIKVENLRLRSELMMVISEHILQTDYTQQQIAQQLRITQPRVSALLQGKIEEFRLDTLVNIAHQLGLTVSLNIAA